jgi:ribosome recycling factor
MSRDDILLEAEMSMEKSVDYMVHEFAAVRTGKASPGLVENVDVHAYGSTMKLKQLALITTPESRLLVVQPFDAATVQDIERALKESKIGITPAVDGKIIRLRRCPYCLQLFQQRFPARPCLIACFLVAFANGRVVRLA